MIRARSRLYCTLKSAVAEEISRLSIHRDLVSTLQEHGVTKLFPIQRAVFHPTIQGRDIVGIAKKGAGKSLAFGIPIIHKIMEMERRIQSSKFPLALALAPDKEAVESLVGQLHFCSRVRVTSALADKPIEKNVKDLKENGTDILVGTPTRILELIKDGVLRLDELRYLVLDEVHQLPISREKMEEVNQIIKKCPSKIQKFVFGATRSTWMRHKFLNNPTIIDLVGDSKKLLGDGTVFLSMAVPTKKTEEKVPIVADLIKTYVGFCLLILLSCSSFKSS